MIRFISCLLVVINLLATGPVLATHVTDKLLAGVYAEPKSKGKPLKMLSSGAPVEVLERGDVFDKVRAEDGTEGWVNSAYLTEDTPAKALLVDAQSRIAELEKQLAEAAAAVTECPDQESIADQAASDGEAVNAPGTVMTPDADGTNCGAISDELTALEGRVKRAADLLGDASAAPATLGVGKIDFADWRVSWHWYAIPVALLVGLVLGILFMDYRARQRYGGVRV